MSGFTFLKDKIVLVKGVSITDERYKNIGQASPEELNLLMQIFQE